MKMPYMFLQGVKSIVAGRSFLEPLAPSPLSYATVAALFRPPPSSSYIDRNEPLEINLLRGSAHGTNFRPDLFLPAHVVVLVVVSFVTLLWYREAFGWKNGAKHCLSKVPQHDCSVATRASEPSPFPLRSPQQAKRLGMTKDDSAAAEDPQEREYHDEWCDQVYARILASLEAEEDEEGLPQSDQLQSEKTQTKEPTEGVVFCQASRQHHGSTRLLIQQARARLAGSLLPRMQGNAGQEDKERLPHPEKVQSGKTQTKQPSEGNTIHQRSLWRHGSIVLLLQQADARLAGSVLPRGQEIIDKEDKEKLPHLDKNNVYPNILDADRSKWTKGVFSSILVVDRKQWERDVYSHVLSADANAWKKAVYFDILAADGKQWKKGVYAGILAAERKGWKRDVYSRILAADENMWKRGVYAGVLAAEQNRWKGGVYSHVLAADGNRWKKNVYSDVLSAAENRWKRDLQSHVLATDQGRRTKRMKDVRPRVPTTEGARRKSGVYSATRRLVRWSLSW